MSQDPSPLIIEAATLPALQSDRVILLDATYLHQPEPPNRDPEDEYKQRRLPGARFWSLKNVSEPHDLGFKLMLPSPERFAKAAGSLGIEWDSHVIVYDTEGAFSAPRTVFTFLAFGHTRVSLLNGGLPAALDAGVSLETVPPQSFTPKDYPVRDLQPGYTSSFEDIHAIYSSDVETKIIVDARNRSNFIAGHIPGAESLPWRELLIAIPRAKTEQLLEGERVSYYRLPNEEELRLRINNALGASKAKEIWDRNLTIVNSCGGGLSAAILWLSLRRLGIQSELYDESWSGYSQRPQAIVAKG